MTTAVILLTLIKPLNEVALAHSEVLPATERLAAQSFGRACGEMLDLYMNFALPPLRIEVWQLHTHFFFLRVTKMLEAIEMGRGWNS